MSVLFESWKSYLHTTHIFTVTLVPFSVFGFGRNDLFTCNQTRAWLFLLPTTGKKRMQLPSKFPTITTNISTRTLGNIIHLKQ